jgi:hypothetical protein
MCLRSHSVNCRTLTGNALGAECKPNSQSIVEDSGQMATAETIAHELGHRYVNYTWTRS